MAAPSTQTMLDNVRTAINDLIVGGAVQAYTVHGRNIQYMNLDQLRVLEKELEQRLIRESTTGGKLVTNYADFKRAD